MKNRKCKNCRLFKTLTLNLLKKEDDMKRIYFVECGLSPNKEHDATDCIYFQKKKLFNL